MSSPVPQGGTFDLEIAQGASFTRIFELREADQVTPIPLTGYTGRAQVRARDGSLILAFTVAVDAPGGNVTISATSAATSAMKEGGRYDVRLTQTGEELVLVRGYAALVPEVSTP